MKTSKIIGKKVLDCEANEVGKVEDIDIDIKLNTINKIIINTSGELSLRKVNNEVTPEMISQVGDYLLLNISRNDIVSEKKDEKEEDVPDVEIINPEEL